MVCICLCNTSSFRRVFKWLEAGKVELWDLDLGENISSTRNTDDDAATCVKVKN